MAMTIEQKAARLKLVADGLRRIQEFESARYLDEYAAHLTPPAQAVDVARRFHETYERLAPSFGYETRPETRVFDPESPNGKLMTAVCAELTLALAGEKAGWRVRAEKLLRDLEFSALGGRRCPCCFGWNDENGETDRQHTKTCELAALLPASPAPGKEG